MCLKTQRNHTIKIKRASAESPFHFFFPNFRLKHEQTSFVIHDKNHANLEGVRITFESYACCGATTNQDS